jgi:hypothetical protein
MQTAAHSTAFPALDEDAFGDWLHGQLLEWLGAEDDAFSEEMTSGVAGRLNACRDGRPLMVVPLYHGIPLAFTAPGRYVYVSRGLLHRAWWRDAVAFAVAHEIAHHDLGHTQLMGRGLTWLRKLPAAFAAHAFLAFFTRRLNGPEREAAADELGLRLCLEAGFDGPRCVELFDVLQAHCLDVGDSEIVWGPQLDEGTPGSFLDGAKNWAWQRVRGYPCLDERRQRLNTLLKEGFQRTATASTTSA